jgi:hypothetical protein
MPDTFAIFIQVGWFNSHYLGFYEMAEIYAKDAATEDAVESLQKGTKPQPPTKPIPPTGDKKGGKGGKGGKGDKGSRGAGDDGGDERRGGSNPEAPGALYPYKNISMSLQEKKRASALSPGIPSPLTGLLEKFCMKFNTHGKCTWGTNCKFIHAKFPPPIADELQLVLIMLGGHIDLPYVSVKEAPGAVAHLRQKI